MSVLARLPKTNERSVQTPMTNRETAGEIDDAAALWAARADAGDLDGAQSAALETWLAGDIRRLGAYARARAVLASADRAAALKGLDTSDRGRAPVQISRRRLAWGAGALAASVAGGVLVWREAGKDRFSTRIGEMRVVTLSDGSTVTLNTASRMVVEISERSREIALLAGEAIFDVAYDANRPFIVRVGEVVIRAIETSVAVRRLNDAAPEILVREGSVEVLRGGGAALRVAAHERIVASTPAPSEITNAQIERELAWRDGRLAFEGETLAQAAQEFARYSQIRLVFEDPSIGNEEVTGLFVSTDPVGFAHAVATAFNLEAETREGEVRLRRPS